MRAHALLLVFACIALIGACSVSGRAHGADHHSRSHARVGSSSSSIVQEHTAYLFDAGVVDEGAQKCNKGNSTQWVLYKQCGESWSSDIIGTSTNTICGVGCAMSSVAMALRTLGTEVDPGTLNTWLIQNDGFADGDLLVWGSVAEFGTMKLYNYFHGAASLSQSDLQGFIAQGWPVIVNVRHGEHWVLATQAVQNSTYLVNDPGFWVNSYTYDDMVNFVVYAL